MARASWRRKSCTSETCRELCVDGLKMRMRSEGDWRVRAVRCGVDAVAPHAWYSHGMSGLRGKWGHGATGVLNLWQQGGDVMPIDNKEFRHLMTHVPSLKTLGWDWPNPIGTAPIMEFINLQVHGVEFNLSVEKVSIEAMSELLLCVRLLEHKGIHATQFFRPPYVAVRLHFATAEISSGYHHVYFHVA